MSKKLKDIETGLVVLIIGIILLVMGSLYAYEQLRRYIKLEDREASLEKCHEENQALLKEVRILTTQNKLLIRVVELKQELE